MHLFYIQSRCSSLHSKPFCSPAYGRIYPLSRLRIEATTCPLSTVLFHRVFHTRINHSPNVSRQTSRDKTTVQLDGGQPAFQQEKTVIRATAEFTHFSPQVNTSASASMEDDRAEVDFGIAADIERQDAPEPALKQPKKRFVGRRTAAQTAASKSGTDSASVDNAGAVEGMVNHYHSSARAV